MASPCFLLLETRELTLKFRGRRPLGLGKLPTPALSGSGSRVFSQPHSVEHPCFNVLIETLRGRFGKSSGQIKGDVSAANAACIAVFRKNSRVPDLRRRYI
jgi:hypothetical protein